MNMHSDPDIMKSLRKWNSFQINLVSIHKGSYASQQTVAKLYMYLFIVLLLAWWIIYIISTAKTKSDQNAKNFGVGREASRKSSLALGDETDTYKTTVWVNIMDAEESNVDVEIGTVTVIYIIIIARWYCCGGMGDIINWSTCTLFII